MGSIGCLGNALSIVAVYKADDNLTSTSIYLIALAITDSLCLVCYICVHIFKTISSPVLFRVVTNIEMTSSKYGSREYNAKMICILGTQ